MNKLIKLTLVASLTFSTIAFAKENNNEVEQSDIFKQFKKMEVPVEKIYEILPKTSVFHIKKDTIKIQKATNLGDLYHVSGKVGQGANLQPFELFITPNGKQIHNAQVVMENGQPFFIPYDMIQHLGKETIKVGDATDPKKQIFVFTDVDCPYCIRFGQEGIDKLVEAGYSVNLFMFPLERLHPKAKAKSLYLLSLPKDERLKALHAIEGNNNTNTSYKIDNAEKFQERLSEQVEIANEVKVTGTPYIVDRYGKRINVEQLMAQ